MQYVCRLITKCDALYHLKAVYSPLLLTEKTLPLPLCGILSLILSPSPILSSCMHLCRTEQVCQYSTIEVDHSAMQGDPVSYCYCSY